MLCTCKFLPAQLIGLCQVNTYFDTFFLKRDLIIYHDDKPLLSGWPTFN